MWNKITALGSTAIILLVIVVGFVYIAWKEFMPGASKDYPDINKMSPVPGFVPKGKTYDNLPTGPQGTWEGEPY